VGSIFDWDMTTLGDPLIDLGTLLNYWPDPADPPHARRFANMAALDLPPRAALVARYAERTGADLANVRWWEAFALWKTVVVVQQLHRRWVRGESTDPRMATVADRIPSLIAAALAVLEQEPR
jgi:aminoglycoside phosphotransferase (APT) family kinase protein